MKLELSWRIKSKILKKTSPTSFPNSKKSMREPKHKNKLKKSEMSLKKLKSQLRSWKKKSAKFNKTLNRRVKNLM